MSQKKPRFAIVVAPIMTSSLDASCLRLSQPAGFALGLEEAEDVVLTDCAGVSLASPYCRPREKRRTGSLDVTDDGSALVVHELDANLGDTTTRTYTPSSVSHRKPFAGRCARGSGNRTGTAEDSGHLD